MSQVPYIEFRTAYTWDRAWPSEMQIRRISHAENDDLAPARSGAGTIAKAGVLGQSAAVEIREKSWRWKH
jgi:hypothetical protein